MALQQKLPMVLVYIYIYIYRQIDRQIDRQIYMHTQTIQYKQMLKPSHIFQTIVTEKQRTVRLARTKELLVNYHQNFEKPTLLTQTPLLQFRGQITSNLCLVRFHAICCTWIPPLSKQLSIFHLLSSISFGFRLYYIIIVLYSNVIRP